MNTKSNFPTTKFGALRTPFYYYNTDLLRQTLDVVISESKKYDNYHVHYAVKANANQNILSAIRAKGLGVDCVSGGEIEAALKAGFESKQIVFAGVGKSDWEINLGLDHDIYFASMQNQFLK
jgi:diaminopimelate decarboxylase